MLQLLQKVLLLITPHIAWLDIPHMLWFDISTFTCGLDILRETKKILKILKQIWTSNFLIISALRNSFCLLPAIANLSAAMEKLRKGKGKTSRFFFGLHNITVYSARIYATYFRQLATNIWWISRFSVPPLPRRESRNERPTCYIDWLPGSFGVCSQTCILKFFKQHAQRAL